ncbi:MAG: hypothetical protein HW403_107 [Dehalococcoidia bacterium]|nr:hypothetical protein [Dehalococcoidia bacterium]
MVPTIDTYLGFIPGRLLLALVTIAGLYLFADSVITKIRYMRKGKKSDPRFDRIGERIKSVIIYVFGQKRLFFRDPFSGTMHALIFWGFMVLLLQNLNFIISGFVGREYIPHGIYLPLSSVWGIFQAFVILGVLMASYRRYIEHLPRLKGGGVTAAVILSLLFGLMFTDFLVDGHRLSIAQLEGEHGLVSWSPGGLVMAEIFDGLGLSKGVQYVSFSLFWWLHVGILLGFLVYIPRSKHLHVFASSFNVFFRNLGPRGALRPIDLENAETLGLTRLEDFSWKDMLDLYNCTECGRCTSVCPANLSGTPLSPKHLILEFQDHLHEEGYKLLLQEGGEREPMDKGAAGEDPIWACRTCFACQAVCPVFIEHVPKIVDMRRNFVLNEGRIPETAQNALINIERRGHPWRGTQYVRGDLMEGLEVPEFTSGDEMEYLYWVGCTGALEERSRKITLDVIKILKAAGVNFGVLGAMETCTGDPARRMGNEYLYQTQAMQVIEMLNSRKVKKIITQCPHCFNTIMNEYPQFEGNYEVIHHSQLIEQLIQQGKLKLTKDIGLDGKVTYHDPCYLGRYNQVFDAPRSVVNALPQANLVEMAWNKEASLCCGAGGGHMWMDDPVGGQVQNIRVQQAIDVGASVIATSCPFCMQMMENGVLNKNKSEEMRVRDIAELVAEAIE